MSNDETELQAEKLFYTTRNAMGYTKPEWNELSEKTKDGYREYIKGRVSIVEVKNGKP